MKWFYESDGGNGSPKTHYLVSEDLLHRIDLNSKSEAMKMLDGMNKGLVCTCTEKAYLNWYVSPTSGNTWVIRCNVCEGNATQRAEVEHGMTNKHDSMESVKSWLELMKYEHEKRIK